MSVKLELYRVFKEVAEAGNITAAAQTLFISQSAVSQSIKQLEAELQTRLFARNSRGVTLTADGRMLYEYVRSAMGLLETGEEKLSQSRDLQMGHLTIGASDTVTSQFLLPYLDRFHRQYPAIHIQIISGRSHKVLGLLQSGKVDIAFASTPQEGALEAAVNGDFGGTALARAAYARDTVLPAMNACRNHADALECLCASHDWPLPSYAELLWLH